MLKFEVAVFSPENSRCYWTIEARNAAHAEWLAAVHAGDSGWIVEEHSARKARNQGSRK